MNKKWSWLAVLAFSLAFILILIPCLEVDVIAKKDSDNKTPDIPEVPENGEKSPLPPPPPLPLGGNGCSYNMTFYPDANPEISSVDGFLYHNVIDQSWATVRDGAGLGASDSGVSEGIAGIWSGGSAWNQIRRGIFVFDIFGLPDDVIVSGVKFGVFGESKVDNAGWLPDINVYSSAPANDIALVAGDYDSLGVTAFSSSISYNSYGVGSWNEFDFNETGISYVESAHEGDGIVRLGTRNANYDVADSPPSFQASKSAILRSYFAEQGNGYKPYLFICYYIPIAPDCPSDIDLIDLGGNTASVNWTVSENATEYLIRYKRNECPVSISDGEFGYSGALTTANITGLALELSKYGFSLWAKNDVGYSACYTINYIGGEDMLDAVLMVLPLASALLLVFISFFQKSILIKLAIICCMWAVFIQEEFQNTWLQSAAIIIIIWAALTAFFRAKEKGAI